MQFNKHSGLAGSHAFLSPSSYHWTNYSLEKLIDTFRNAQASKRGVELHDFANNAIRLGIKLPRSKSTLNQYVNDAIGFRMNPEQVLFYSVNAYGTSDAISFRNNKLRIHDLKTGYIPGNFRQLEVYNALFCLEYNMAPGAIESELRIYQGDEVLVHHPDVDVIAHIMDVIVTFDKQIEKMRVEEG